MGLIRKTYNFAAKLIKREINYYRVKPNNILFYLTYRCTSRCNTCTIWRRKASQQELSLEELKNFIDTVIGLGIEHIEMFGGDALLRKDVLIPLVEYAKKMGIPHSDLTTNCNLMDEETARALIGLKLDVIYVSLDGVGELHDKIRGVPGSFERAKRGLEYLIKAKNGRKLPRIVANCTVSSLNINDFEKIIPFAEEICADSAAFEYAGEFSPESLSKSKINGIEPEPYYAFYKPTLRLNKEQAKLLKQKISILKKNRKKSIQIETGNIDVLRIKNLVSGIFSRKRCYICRYLITLDPYGNIIPCPFFDKYPLGNIRETKFDEIWNNDRHKKFINYADGGRFDICKYCIIGVERNPSLFQAIRKSFLVLV